MRYYHYEGAIITGDYGCPQPDTVDGQGNIVKGFVTVQLPDNHPDVLAYLSHSQPAAAEQKKNEKLGKKWFLA